MTWQFTLTMMGRLLQVLGEIFRPSRQVNAPSLGLRELILLTIYCSSDHNEHSCLATRLHKVIFLVKMLFKRLLKHIPEPEPGPYGPYFRDILHELQKLKEEGLIEIAEVEGSRGSKSDTGIMRLIKLTGRGIEEARKLESELMRNKDYRELIDTLREYSEMKLWSIVGMVYLLYPEYVLRGSVIKQYRYA